MCDCIKRIEDDLKKHPEGANTILVTTLFGEPKAVVATCKRQDSVRKKASLVLASYCPFCGEKYGSAAKAA